MTRPWIMLASLLSVGLCVVGLWAATMTGPSGTPVLLTETNGLTVNVLGTGAYVRLAQQAVAPGIPAAGQWNLYPKAAGLFIQGPTGPEVGPIGTGQVTLVRTLQTLAAGATIAHAGRLDVIEILPITSTGGVVTNTATLRIAAGLDGQAIILQGTSPVNVYVVPDGNGVKWASASDVSFDDRMSRLLIYRTSIGSWREGTTGGGTGTGGGTAASISFAPTGTVSGTNVQTALAEVAAEAEQVASKGANNGYAPLNATGNVPWDRTETPAVHPTAIGPSSQIDAATSQATVLAIQSSGGNVTPNPGGGAARITGCSAATDGTHLLLVGISSTNTVTLPNGQGVLLAGNTGAVTIGLPPGGTSARFVCRGATSTWEQVAVPSAQQVYSTNPNVAITLCGAATNPVFEGASGNKWEFCLNASGRVQILGYCDGVPCPWSELSKPKVATTGTQPTCDASARTAIWHTQGGAGVADTTQTCQKTAADTYAWTSMTSASPTDRSARVLRTTNQTIATGTDTAVDFDSEEFDTAGFWSAGTPSRFVFTTAGAGKYAIHCVARFDGPSTGLRDIFIRKNGTTKIADNRTAGNNVDDDIFHVQTFAALLSTDYVEFVVNQASGASLDLIASPGRAQACEVYRIF